MKKNVSYRLKKGAMQSGSYFLFGGQKYYADNLTQEQMRVLYKNGIDKIEVNKILSSEKILLFEK